MRSLGYNKVPVLSHLCQQICVCLHLGFALNFDPMNQNKEKIYFKLNDVSLAISKIIYCLGSESINEENFQGFAEQ